MVGFNVMAVNGRGTGTASASEQRPSPFMFLYGGNILTVQFDSRRARVAASSLLFQSMIRN